MIKRFLDGRGVKMSINKNELTKELIQKAMACKTAEELMATAKAMGYELTKDEAEAYLTELSDFELDSEALTKVAGGGCYTECNSEHVIVSIIIAKNGSKYRLGVRVVIRNVIVSVIIGVDNAVCRYNVYF